MTLLLQEIVVLLESTKYTVDDAAFRAAYERVKAGFQKLPTFGCVFLLVYVSAHLVNLWGVSGQKQGMCKSLWSS